MSKNAEEAFNKLHHNNGSNNKRSYEPITEDIVDWCVRGDDYREATSLTSPQSPASHQQMRRRRKKKNITTAPSLATVAVITPHTAMPTPAPTPLSTFNHPQNYHPYHPYAINFPSDTDDRKDIQYQNQANYYGNSNSLNLYFLYGDSLARCGQLREAFDIYAFIASNYLDGCIPLSRLKVLSSMLIDYISTASATTAAKTTPQPPAAPTLRRAASSSLAMETNSTIGGGGSGSTATVVLPLHTNVSCDRLQDRLRYSKNKRIQRYWKDGGGGCGDSVGGGGGGGGGGVYGSGGGSVISRIGGDVGLCDDDHVRFCDVMLNEDHQEAFSEKQYFATSAMAEEIELDPLLCPICKDILRCPVTANCGHSFCRECCEAATMCVVCRVKFPTSFTAVPVASSEFISSAPMMATLYNSNANTNASQYMGFAAVDRDNTNTTTHSQLHNNSNSNSNSSSSAAAALIHNGGGREGGSNSSNDNHNANSNGSNSMKFMPDVLVRRLVEKWWGADLQAKTINERAASFVSLNLLDDALKFCNASLEKCPNNFNSLLLRAEVLRKLNHYQSSLADIDHALGRKSLSAKAHYHRSLALCALGRLDEALVDQFLAISLDDTNFTLSSTELFQHDLAKLLQKLLAQSPKKIHLNSTPTSAPYDIVLESRQRRKQIGLLNNNFNDTINSEVTTDCDLLRQGSRKHCRRKSYSSAGRRQKQTSQPPPTTATQVKFFGSTRFDSILERTQEEVQRIKESESDLSQDQRHLIPVNPNLIDASDFDCVLCCRTFWKPVVTPCGHTYCWVCLDRCMDYKPSCPLCPLCMSPLVEQHVNVLQGSSSPVPFILAKRPVTKFLEAAMKRFIPECYEKRFRQEMDLEPSVPVFICTTAFPHVPCPLFVYEPRYRLMVRRAVESGEKQFGIVQPHSGKSRYFDVGTILDIRDCVLLGDGCSILSTIGCKRFRILARNEKDGYETAKVEYIYDEIITEDNVAFISKMHASVLSKAAEWYESLGTELKEEILRSFGEMPAVEENWESIADGPAWAWWIIALLPLNQQLKVDILATTSLEKRLRAIEKTLDCMSGTFKRSQQSCVVVPREDIQQCQAVECCQRSSSELSSTSDTHTTSEHSHLML